MSTLAKIFVVINLFLALAFVGVSATFLAEQDNWKTKFENVSDELAAVRSVSAARVARLEQERNDQIRNSQALTDRLQEVMREWERSREANANLVERQSELETRLSSLDASYKDIGARIQEVSDENTRLSSLLRQREGERDDAREAQRQAEEAYFSILTELEAAEDRLRELGQVVAERTKEIEDLEIENTWLTESPGSVHSPVAPPAIDGKVVAVSADTPLVMLNVGHDDRVEAGHVFTVYRGDTYVAKVRVKDVFKDSASAMIIPAYQKLAPREGDNVSTRIY